jgi:precorrin-6Y C5,15-methyltransferase (decarboxylating)
MTVLATSSKNNQCTIIGIHENGERSLNPAAIERLKLADVIFGANRFIDSIVVLLKDASEKIDFQGQLTKLPDKIERYLKENKRVVVLATGDPLCHGIAAFLVKKLGINRVDIIPNTSMFQVLFARIGLIWQSVKICSVHTKNLGPWTKKTSFNPVAHGMYPLFKACQNLDLIACYTSPDNTPSRIAEMLTVEGIDNTFEIVIGSRLTSDDERITQWLPVSEVVGQVYPEPNIVLLRRINPRSQRAEILLGHEDGYYFQRKPDKGLITKQEVRAVSLAKLQLRENSIVWDIGAGSGSVGLEAARLCSSGRVFAIEKNIDDFNIIKDNLKKYALENYFVQHGKAPDGLDEWINPDAIFIGGSGGNLGKLIKLCLERLNPSGVLVMNFITLENMHSATAVLKQYESLKWEFIQMQVSRSRPILSMHRLQAENPVFVVTAKLESEKT